MLLVVWVPIFAILAVGAELFDSQDKRFSKNKYLHWVLYIFPKAMKDLPFPWRGTRFVQSEGKTGVATRFRDTISSMEMITGVTPATTSLSSTGIRTASMIKPEDP